MQERTYYVIPAQTTPKRPTFGECIGKLVKTELDGRIFLVVSHPDDSRKVFLVNITGYFTLIWGVRDSVIPHYYTVLGPVEFKEE